MTTITDITKNHSKFLTTEYRTLNFLDQVFILFDDEEFTYHQLANTMPQHHYGNSKTMDVLTGDLEALTELDLLEHDPNEDTYHIGNGGKNAINQNDPRFSARAYQKIGDDLKETHDY